MLEKEALKEKAAKWSTDLGSWGTGVVGGSEVMVRDRELGGGWEPGRIGDLARVNVGAFW